jgi:hypothetical protein
MTLAAALPGAVVRHTCIQVVFTYHCESHWQVGHLKLEICVYFCRVTVTVATPAMGKDLPWAKACHGVASTAVYYRTAAVLLLALHYRDYAGTVTTTVVFAQNQ